MNRNLSRPANTRPATAPRPAAAKALTALGWVMAVLGLLGTLPLIVLWVAPRLQALSFYTVALASFIPLWWIPAVCLAGGLSLALRAWWRLLGVGVVAVILVIEASNIASIVGGWGPDALVNVEPDESETRLAVVSVNAQYGQVDVDALLKSVSEGYAPADVLIISEHTPALAEALTEAGLKEQMPYVVGTQRTDAGGTAIYSRAPLRQVATSDTAFDNIVVTTTKGGAEYVVAGVHATAPQLGGRRWDSEGAALADLFAPYVNENFLAIGDFNAIDQHLTMRRFYSLGLENAAWEQTSGLRWWPTWPVGSTVPPFVRIDHALCGPNLACTMPNLIALPGTDHMALSLWIDARA
ncbi:MAG: endonuclease/exonuclease/phosphatase family protein [Arachnia sp.]